MKKTFFRILPFVAAVVLAASCGKDGDSDVNISAPEPVVTPDPTQTTVGDGFVEIPFFIKVNDGNTLSKVALDVTTKAIDFDPEDYKTVKLSVEGKTVSGISGTLDLSEEKPYSFSGNITVPEGLKDDFSNPDNGIDLVGTFTQCKVETPVESSTTSFEDLWNSCTHTYKAEFKSTASNLTLVDQNFYIYVATYKEDIKIGENEVTSDGNFTKGTYYVFPISTSVTDNGSSKSIAPSKLYTIGEYVDLGVVVGGKKILFAKDNTYDSKKWSDLSEDELKLLPTKEEWKALVNSCNWTWDDTEGHKGYTVSSTSTGQSIFLPVTPGKSDGVCWSSTENEYRADLAYCLDFNSGRENPEYAYDKSHAWSVRTVRRN